MNEKILEILRKNNYPDGEHDDDEVCAIELEQLFDAEMRKATKQRDELLKAINSLLFMATGKGEPCGDLNWDAAEKRAIAAIKSTEI